MGIHGSATSVMTFENSVGWLIGQPNTGLHQMFTFMNTARLGTAIQGQYPSPAPPPSVCIFSLSPIA
jgi:alkylation response protein AidB-like acyl-CoA dehydrogenase